MNKLKIGLDVDDVLSAFYIAFAIKHKRPIHPVNIWKENFIVKNFNYDNLREDFWINLPVLSDPISITFDVDCYISSLPDEFQDIRRDWLAMNGFPIAPLILSFDKLQVVKDRNLDYFIDDKVETIKKINNSEHKCVGIQFVPMYHTPEEYTKYWTRNLNGVKNIINGRESRKI